MSQFSIEIISVSHPECRAFLDKHANRLAKDPNHDKPFPKEFRFETKKEAEEAKKSALLTIQFRAPELFRYNGDSVAESVANKACLEERIKNSKIVEAMM